MRTGVGKRPLAAFEEKILRVRAFRNFGARARIDYANSFPVFDNQPALKKLEQFILADIGTHILDVSRFLFGEATELFCLNASNARRYSGRRCGYRYDAQTKRDDCDLQYELRQSLGI